MAEFFWRNEDWQSTLHWGSPRLATALVEARRLRGKTVGVGFDPPAQMPAAAVDEAIRTSVSEGERLDRDPDKAFPR